LKKKFNTIAVIGNSKKFIKVIKKKYTFKKIDIYEWRKIDKYSKIKKKYHLIFICGFDFSVFLSSKKMFIEKNIERPLNLIKKISNNNSKIIYINTKIRNNSRYTFSRYKYAKQKLAFLISKNFKRYLILNTDLIFINNQISINSGGLSKLIFRIFVFFDLIKTININNVFNDLSKKLNFKICTKQINIVGYFLWLPRTQFIDRIARLIFG
tara:strand:- start:2469 stop:3101 length:633 start_codon:yes stop_codon:yes gene_type:complete